MPKRHLPPHAYAPLYYCEVRHATPLYEPTLDRLLGLLGLTAGGAGATEDEAWVSAVFEAVERASGFYPGPEPFPYARYPDLDGEAIHPNEILQFSDDQYASRATWNRRAHQFLRVPEPFDPSVPTHWVRAWSVTGPTSFRWVPCGLAFYGYPFRGQPVYAYADSNGCATGSFMEEAVLHGLYELAERDGVALWHRSRSQRPAVDLESLSNPLAVAIVDDGRRRRRTTAALDVTTDLRIPTFVAVSYRWDWPHGVALGFGSHLSPAVAAEKALAEMHLMAVETDHPEGPGSPLAWADSIRLDDHPFLTPHPDRPLINLASLADPTTPDIRNDVRIAASRFRDAGFPTYMIDQTHAAIGIPTARVVSPGLVHFWRRLGGTRVAEGPAQLGWVDTPVLWDSDDAVEITT